MTNEVCSPEGIKEKTLDECVESLECLFKNSKGSDYNYQLNVSNSAFNLLRNKHIKVLKLVKKAPGELGFLGTCEDYNAYIKTFTDIGCSQEDAPYSEEEFNLLKEYFGKEGF